MIDLKHSPGPWFLEAETCDSYYEISDDFGTSLAKVEAWDGDNDEEVMGEAKANARLIAAAPELLESLIELIAFVNDRGEWAGFEPFVKARGVIAKAKVA